MKRGTSALLNSSQKGCLSLLQPPIIYELSLRSHIAQLDLF